MEKKINIIKCDMTISLKDAILALEKENSISLISSATLTNYLYDEHLITIIAKDEKNVITGFLIAKNLIDSIDLEYILVDKNFRNMNIALGMIDTLFSSSKDLQIKNILLEVRISNIAAINLYKKAGFSIVHKRKGYYKDNLEDALIMQKILT